MRIAVIGCGAMGSIYAGLLAAAGHELLVVDRNMAHVDAINSQGLRVSGASGDQTLRVQAYSTPPAGQVDLVILAVKAGQAGAAAASALPLLAADTPVLTIQNGLGAADAVAAAVAADRVIVGVAQGFGASLPAPGHAHHNAMKAIRMGAYNGLTAANREKVEQIADIWRRAGFDAAAVQDIQAMQWQKLICNVAYSAPCAITGLTLGAMLEQPQLAAVSQAAATEAWTIAQARGIAINISDPVAHVLEFAAGMLDAKPSVLLDLAAGRHSEVDVINGAIPREAAKVGLQAPVNQTLTALVLALEAGWRKA